MSAFSHGFNFGFATGMFNRIFGGFNPFCGCGFFQPYNSWGGFGFMSTFNNWNSMPSFNIWNSTSYSMPSFSTPVYNTSVFNAFSSLPMNNTINWNFAGVSNQFWNYSTGDTYTPTTNNITRNYSDSDTTKFSGTAEELKNKWSKVNPNLSQGFFNKVVEISNRLNCNPNDLLAVMNSESGLKSTAVNKKSNATGLIQFMPKTATGLGTSVTALKSMSPEEQLVYVEKYLTNAKKSAKLGNQQIGPGTLYALVFLPANANKDILTQSGEEFYSWNPALDLDGDGKISKADLAKRVQNHNVV